MDGTNPPPEKSGDLNFEKVDDGAKGPSQSNCVLCHEPLTYQYYEVNRQVVCPPCKDNIEAQNEQNKGAQRYLKAFMFGLPAGIVGSGIYYGLTVLLDAQWGIMAIAIGYLVGIAVRYGSGHRGSIGLQIMAAFITYCAICSTFIPQIIQELKNEPNIEALIEEDNVEDVEEDVSGKMEIGSMSAEEAEALTSGVITDETLEEFDRYSPAGGVTTLEKHQEETEDAAPAISSVTSDQADSQQAEDITLSQLLMGYFMLFLIALIAPWFAGPSYFVGWLIIGIGVYQAWIMNKYTPLEFKGPFDIKRR
ncbi:MAG: hypothetical protein KC897_06745 [Candidatus Omnitrophica bacterium]|nr:hypothetical protein [Candidatus Omnitrophota bacterium]MCB9720048.1 hypothetical protein [Candidatus Omnitrophota bacterium]